MTPVRTYCFIRNRVVFYSLHHHVEYHWHIRMDVLDPIAQGAQLLAVVIKVMGGVGRRLSGFLLQGIRLLLSTVLSEVHALDDNMQETLDTIPNTIDSAMASFGLRDHHRLLAVCPTCHSTYELPYPDKCDHRPAIGVDTCDTPLLVSREGDESARPIRVFPVHDFDDYISSLFALEDVENELDASVERIERYMSQPPADLVTDIEEAEYVREMKGPDGLPFFRREGNEARCGFAFFYDDFNAEGSTQRSESASYGAIGLAPLGLPASKRYRSDFFFIFGIVPFPVPKGVALNGYILPLMKKMERAWSRGTHLSRTAKHRNGRVVRSAILPMIMDLKARHEVLQAMQATSGHFCTLCDLSGVGNWGRFDYRDWRRYTCGELKYFAEAWKDAGEDTREQLYKERGFRWSALWVLPYFDPTRQVVIDGMHAIFLRLSEYHARRILHLEIDQKTGKIKQGPLPTAFDESLLEPITPDYPDPPDDEVDNIAKIRRLLAAGVLAGDDDYIFESHLERLHKRLCASNIRLAALQYVADSLRLYPLRDDGIIDSNKPTKKRWANALIAWVSHV